MADQETMLICPVCHVTYDSEKHEAKLLACHHSCCLSCLSRLAANRPVLRCAQCNAKTSVPPGGIAKLQQNFYIYQMLQVEPSVGERSQETCSKHNQPQMFYCSTCSIAICMNCTVLDHDKNKGHKIEDISAVTAELQVTLTENVVQAKKAANVRKNTLEALKTELECLEIAKEHSVKKIQTTFEHLRGEIAKREKELMDSISKQYEAKKQAIIETGQSLKAENKQLGLFVRSYERLANGQGTRAELLRAINDSTLSSIQGQVKPTSNGGYITFLQNHNLHPLLTAIKDFGTIDSSKDLPSVFKVQIPSLISAQSSMIIFKAFSTTGCPLTQYPISVSIKDSEEDAITNRIKSKTDGIYEASFIPHISGTHELHFQFLGQMLSGSRSFQVNSNDPVRVIGKPGQDEGQLQKPTSVTTDSRGNIYVADMGNKRVQLFDPKGQYLNKFGLGSSKTTTYDIAINNATEELLCTKVVQPDQGPLLTNTVRVFSLSGEKKRQFVGKDLQNGLFLTINKKGWIIVSDSASNAIHVFSKEGATVAKFGGEGDKPGRFNFPAAVCTGPENEIIVVDTKNHRVQVFDYQGKFKGQIGSEGKGKGQFYLPRGVACDDSGNILVADSLNRVQLFHKGGQYLATIESHGDPINDPYNLSATPDSFLLVTDFKNHCVKKYKYNGLS